MSREYNAITDAGFVLQLDCPDLALRNFWFPDPTVEEFRRVIAEQRRGDEPRPERHPTFAGADARLLGRR